MASRAGSWRHQGIDFWYAEKGEGLPFVFQHGLGGDRRGPLELYAYRPDVRLIALDCRGHGKTQPVGDVDHLRFDVFADDIVALLDHLGIGQCVAGGVSMGAGVALNLALRYPQRLRALLLVRPAWLAQPAPPNLECMAAVGQLIGAHGVERGKERFLDSDMYRHLRAEAPYTADMLLAQFDEPRAADAWPRLVRLPADAPNREPAAWGGIDLPALVLGNQADLVHPYAYAETLAAAIPAARLLEVPSKAVDARAHVAAVRQEIGRFLDDVIGMADVQPSHRSRDGYQASSSSARL
jgi:pimeloyl-ACP methyl ester carboxylesterase